MRDLVQEYLFRRREDLQGPLWLVESVPVKGHPNFTWGTIVPIPEREFMGVREDDGSVVIVVVSGKKKLLVCPDRQQRQYHTTPVFPLGSSGLCVHSQLQQSNNVFP